MGTVRELMDSGKAYDMMVSALLKGELASAGNLSVIVSMQAQELNVDKFLPGECTMDKVHRLIDSRAMMTIAKFVGDICAEAVMDALDDDDNHEMDDFNSSLGSHVDPSDCFPSLDAAARAVR
jgi:hypothetical protein